MCIEFIMLLSFWCFGFDLIKVLILLEIMVVVGLNVVGKMVFLYVLFKMFGVLCE